MSRSTNEPEDALCSLPVIEPEARAAARSGRAARAAFVSAFEPDPWNLRALGRPIARIALPVGLASLVAIYGTWAISATLSLM